MASLSHGHLDIITNNHHFFCFSQFVKPKVCEAVHSGVKLFLNLNPMFSFYFRCQINCKRSQPRPTARDLIKVKYRSHSQLTTRNLSGFNIYGAHGNVLELFIKYRVIYELDCYFRRNLTQLYVRCVSSGSTHQPCSKSHKFEVALQINNQQSPTLFTLLHIEDF